jgi:hypothetical protein
MDGEDGSDGESDGGMDDEDGSGGGDDGGMDGEDGSGGGDDGGMDDEDGPDGESDGGMDGEDGSDGGDGGDGSDGGGGDGSGSPENVSTPTGEEGWDWDDVASREEASGFDLPDGAPSAFGHVRGGGTLTISYGTMMGSDPVESGTVYVLLVVDGSAEEVLVWEPTIEDGDEIVVGPDDSVLQMDVSRITALVFAWEFEGELYVVDRNAETLRFP